MAFPFLSLPLELQRDTLGHLVNHADLRALCLVSKHIEAIAGPLLFHDLALSQYRGCLSCSFGFCKLIPRRRLTAMIKAISESKNLCCVRTLSIPILEDQDAADAMEILLFKLQTNSLRRFDFYPQNTSKFPNINHMEYILTHQRMIQNLTLPRHLLNQTCRQRLRKAILQSSLWGTITDVEMFSEPDVDPSSRLNYWLLDHLDLTRLRRMTLDGTWRDSGLLTRLNLLFLQRVLVGLTHLNLNFWWEQAIVLQNCPSLEHLTFTNSASRLRFETPGKQRLSSLHFCSIWLEDLVNILTQSRGLKSLIARNLQARELCQMEQLAAAIGAHKESLQFLDLELCEVAVLGEKASLACHVENIKRCDRLSLLAIPVFKPDTFLEDCKSLVKVLPCLVALVIYDYSKELTVCPHENNLDTVALLANRVMAGIPASSRFLLLCFSFGKDTRPLHNDSQCRCFARRGREALFGVTPNSVAAEETAVRVRPDQARQLFCESEEMRHWALQDLSAPRIY